MLERTRAESCLSDLALDRMVVGESTDGGEHLAGCEQCRARLDALKSEHAGFGDQVFVAGQAAQALRASRAPRRRMLWGGASGLLAVALALVVVSLNRPPDGVRLKGGGLAIDLVARRAGGQVERVLPGGELRPGDAVRFRLTSDADGWLVVLGVDSAPRVTAYAPASGKALALHAAREQILDGSIVLDETLGAERVVASLCPRQIAVSEVVAAAERALAAAHGDPSALGELGLGCRQASVLIRKVAK